MVQEALPSSWLASSVKILSTPIMEEDPDGLVDSGNSVVRFTKRKLFGSIVMMLFTANQKNG